MANPLAQQSGMPQSMDQQQAGSGELGSGWRCVKSEDYGQTYIFGEQCAAALVLRPWSGGSARLRFRRNSAFVLPLTSRLASVAFAQSHPFRQIRLQQVLHVPIVNQPGREFCITPKLIVSLLRRPRSDTVGSKLPDGNGAGALDFQLKPRFRPTFCSMTVTDSESAVSRGPAWDRVEES